MLTRVICLFALAGCTTTGVTRPTAPTQPAVNATGPFWTHKATGLRFGTKIEGLERTKIDHYGGALGDGVHYIATDEKGVSYAKYSVYVYTGGLRSIPHGADNAIVKAQLGQAARDIFAMEQRGRYRNVQKVQGSDKKHRAGGLIYASVRFTLEANGRRGSDILITGYRNHFIKIRITYLPETAAKTHRLVLALLSTITKGLVDSV